MYAYLKYPVLVLSFTNKHYLDKNNREKWIGESGQNDGWYIRGRDISDQGPARGQEAELCGPPGQEELYRYRATPRRPSTP